MMLHSIEYPVLPLFGKFVETGDAIFRGEYGKHPTVEHQMGRDMTVARDGGKREAGFVLHERLAADTWRVADLPLCRVLLMNNACWPWLILVPRRAGAVEMHRLHPADQQTLMAEIARVSTLMEERFYPDKLNVAAIGNIVPQLHIHIVARTRDDPAWPGPVWGSGHAQAYDPHMGRERLAALAAALV